MDLTVPQDPNDLALLVREIIASRDWGEDAFDPGLWRELGKAGALAAALPEAAGGSGLGVLGHCAMLAEIGRALGPAPYLASIALGAAAIAEFGTAEQLSRWAEPAARGDLLLAAAIPATAAAGFTGREVSPGERWVLAGHCDEVAGAPWAEEFLIPAAGRVFVVERAAVEVADQELTDGVTAGRISLDDVPVTAERMLGGAEVTDWLAAHGTVGVCAHQLGVCERALELTAEHARTRIAFGRPIGMFQAVSQRLADAWIDMEAIRLTTWQAAWLLSEGLPGDVELSTAKFWAADAGHRIAHTAVHVHGGIGIDVSYPLHRYFAAAKHNEFALGAATAHLLRIGAALAAPTAIAPSSQ